MYKVKVNDKYNFEITSEKEHHYINGISVETDFLKVNSGTFHILHNNKSYNAELIEIERSEKTCSIKVGSSVYTMKLTDSHDELLHQLGMDNLSSAKVSELRAPMPGLVLRVLTTDGESVPKGGNLLVLEAMKMENIIKAPADVVVKTIKVKAGDKVEKNQVMMIFS